MQQCHTLVSLNEYIDAEQVFFVSDPAKKNWSIVLPSNKNHQEQVDAESNEYLNMPKDDLYDMLWSKYIDIDEDENEDEPLYMRHDHEEGT